MSKDGFHLGLDVGSVSANTVVIDGKKNVIATLLDAAQFAQLFKLDGWNDVVIIAKGNNIKHYLNGVLILDFTDKDPQLALKQGIIALQLHTGKPMWAEFKNIRIQDLGR